MWSQTTQVHKEARGNHLSSNGNYVVTTNSYGSRGNFFARDVRDVLVDFYPSRPVFSLFVHYSGIYLNFNAKRFCLRSLNSTLMAYIEYAFQWQRTYAVNAPGSKRTHLEQRIYRLHCHLRNMCYEAMTDIHGMCNKSKILIDLWRIIIIRRVYDIWHQLLIVCWEKTYSVVCDIYKYIQKFERTVGSQIRCSK